MQPTMQPIRHPHQQISECGHLTHISEHEPLEGVAGNPLGSLVLPRLELSKYLLYK